VARMVERVAAEVGVAEDDALDSRPSTTMSGSLTIRTLLVLVGLALNVDFSTHYWQLTRSAIAASATIKQESFATPDDALKAVVDDSTIKSPVRGRVQLTIVDGRTIFRHPG